MPRISAIGKRHGHQPSRSQVRTPTRSEPFDARLRQAIAVWSRDTHDWRSRLARDRFVGRRTPDRRADSLVDAGAGMDENLRDGAAPLEGGHGPGHRVASVRTILPATESARAYSRGPTAAIGVSRGSPFLLRMSTARPPARPTSPRHSSIARTTVDVTRSASRHRRSPQLRTLRDTEIQVGIVHRRRETELAEPVGDVAARGALVRGPRFARQRGEAPNQSQRFVQRDQLVRAAFEVRFFLNDMPALGA